MSTELDVDELDQSTTVDDRLDSDVDADSGTLGLAMLLTPTARAALMAAVVTTLIGTYMYKLTTFSLHGQDR